VQTEATYGHTSRKYLWSWTDFAGAIATLKSLSGILGIMKLLKGGKSELISFADSQKILGGKSRTRIGIKASPLQSLLGKIPFIGPKHAKTIAEWAYWKESQLTYGDRSDVIVGHINRVVVRGDETVVYSGEDNDKSKVKFVKKAMGIPREEYKKGMTTSIVGASNGYIFSTDKSYKVMSSGEKDEEILFMLGASQLKISSSDQSYKVSIIANDHLLNSDESTEKISETKTIKSNVVNVACKESLNLGVSRSTIRIVKGNVTVAGPVDLGQAGLGIEVDDEERLAREEQEAAAREAAYQRIREENRLRDQILQESELGDLFKE
jgi:hypothetical protein